MSGVDSRIGEAESPQASPQDQEGARLPLVWLTLFAGVSGPLLLVVLLSAGWVDGTALAIFAVMFVLGMIGLELGFHRCFSHAAFTPSRPLRACLLILGSMGVQGSALFWVTLHRKHHRLSDRPGDPHTPRAPGESDATTLRSLAYGHMGWLFDGRDMPDSFAELFSYSRDLLRDRSLMQLDRLYPVWVALGLVLPTVAGFLATGTAFGALLGFLWGGLIRIALTQHVVWTVNSICHSFGRRPFETRDRSGNVSFLLGPLSLGASLHNDHHAFPGSAKMGFGNGQLDPGYLVIRGFALLGQVSNIQIPDPRQIEARRQREPRLA